jgi:hypothetical protein
MKKVQLKLEALKVESFETAERPAERGTVNAHQIGTQVGTQVNNCTDTTCPPYHCFCTEQNTCWCQID